VAANTALLEVKQLSTWLESGDVIVRAVDGLSFTIRQGETFALWASRAAGSP
jgi:ABC-type oligopeptide transport system ATPase subunit